MDLKAAVSAGIVKALAASSDTSATEGWHAASRAIPFFSFFW
jgi:hypothetical protein